MNPCCLLVFVAGLSTYGICFASSEHERVSTTTPKFLNSASVPTVYLRRERTRRVEDVAEQFRRRRRRRKLTTCSDDKTFFRLDLRTGEKGDVFLSAALLSFRGDLIRTAPKGSGTSWLLRKKADSGRGWRTLVSRPPKGRVYSTNETFTGGLCLAASEYIFIVNDSSGDGMGFGSYAGYVGSEQVFVSEAGEEWSRKSHMFRVDPSGNDHSDDQALMCNANQVQLRLVIQCDLYGEDTSWQLTNAEEGNVILKSTRQYGSNEKDTEDVCVSSSGSYQITIRDSHEDGMCCDYGIGSFQVIMLEENNGWKQILSVGEFQGPEITRSFGVSADEPPDTMTQRDLNWLQSHNVRRKKWHTLYEKPYVALKWSDALKRESRVFAEVLLDNCELYHLSHDPLNIHGENLALNYGYGDWALQRTTENVLTRWVEEEVDLEYPENGHLIQALWRASKYVGCADSRRVYDDGSICRTQACRYARPGNCNVPLYETNQTDWWAPPTMADWSPCLPMCPPDGCA